MAALTFGILAVLVSHSMGRWGRSLVYAICAVIVVAIAYSRVYLGAHWLSDVLAGLLFGAVMSMAFAIAIEAIPPRRIRPLGLFAATLIVFLGAGAAHVWLNYAAAEEAYAVRERVTSQAFADWQGEGWRKLPARRIDLVGRTGEEFVAELAGSLDAIRLTFEPASWKEVPKWTWRAALPYLDPGASLADLPPRPALHEGLKAKLTLIRQESDSPNLRLVLRVFKTSTSVSLRGRSEPVYLVSLTREVLRSGFHLYAVPSPALAIPEEIAAVRARLSGSSRLLPLNPQAIGEGAEMLLLGHP
jgi:undecaprenyl-diphosphatase